MQRDIVVIGASAGGLEMLRRLVAQFPADFGAAVLVVWHIAPQSPDVLGHILSQSGPLPAAQARDGEPLQKGRIVVAAPDRHLLIGPGGVRVARGPKENRFRPSVDVLFRSAALHFGPRVTGIVLTGSLDDGAAGLYAIKERGGIAMVQNPDEALYPEMPLNALRATRVDYVLPVAAMGAVLNRLTQETVSDLELSAPETMRTEVRIASGVRAMETGFTRLGQPSDFTCPECHGTLRQITEGGRTRFRCHTGHAFSFDALLAEITESVEDALWNGVRAIEESEMLLSHLAQHLAEQGQTESAALFAHRARQAHARGEIVRQAALSSETFSESNPRATNSDATD